MISIQIESLKQARKDLEELFPAHWNELAHHKESIPLDMNWEVYTHLCKTGGLLIVTARDNSQLIGYYIGIVQAGLHYKSTITCQTDMFYMKPEYRQGWTGYKMLKFARDTLTLRGVTRWIVSHKVGSDLSSVFRRLGLNPIDNYYDMIL